LYNDDFVKCHKREEGKPMNFNAAARNPTLARMPTFEEATLRASVRDRGHREYKIDLENLKPGSIVWARSFFCRSESDFGIQTDKNRPYLVWNIQQVDEDHVPVLHAFTIQSGFGRGYRHQFPLDNRTTHDLYGGFKDAHVGLGVMNIMPLTSEFFSDHRKNYSPSANSVIIRNPDYTYPTEMWRGLFASRFAALMWSPHIQHNGPTGYDGSGVLAGIQLPFDYAVRDAIAEQRDSYHPYLLPPAPDCQNGPDDQFEHKYHMSDVHGLPESDLRKIAIDVFSAHARRFIPDQDVRDRIAAIITGGDDAPKPRAEVAAEAPPTLGH
jgi:hypothetical protein